MITSFLDWSEKSPYGLLAAILLVQGNVIAPGISILILYSESNIALIGLTVIFSMALVVLNLSLSPPRLIGKAFLWNVAYHLVLAVALFIRLASLG